MAFDLTDVFSLMIWCSDVGLGFRGGSVCGIIESS